MKKRVALLLIILLFIVGCSPSTPDVLCEAPYIEHGTSCCMDQNSNSICDDDEDIMFEPKYLPAEVPYEEVEFEDFEDLDKVYEESEKEVPQLEITEKEPASEPEVEYTPTTPAYTAVKPELTGWDVETELMSMKVTGIVIEVVDIKPKGRTSPDKKAYLKEIHLEVENKEYSFINPKFHFRLMDERDPSIIRDTLLCDRDDDIPMIGCYNLPRWETMEIIMEIDREIPRLDLGKTIRITLENKRDVKLGNILKLEKDVDDILNIIGAEYI